MADTPFDHHHETRTIKLTDPKDVGQEDGKIRQRPAAQSKVTHASSGGMILSLILTNVTEENSFDMIRTHERVDCDIVFTSQQNPSLRISFRRQTRRIELQERPTGRRTPLGPFPRAGEPFRGKLETRKPQNGVQLRYRSFLMSFPQVRRTYLP